MEGCIFCKIIKGEIPSTRIYEDEKVYAFADINPILEGHTLIIPKRHSENLWEIPEADLSAIHAASKKVAAAMKKGLGADGVACVQLNGKSVNQVVMHYHFHLIPHQPGGPDLPMTAWDLKPGDMDQIKENAAKIAGAFTKT